MSKIEYKWEADTPPVPDVYTTRRNQSKYLTLRYWDGGAWFQITATSSRGGIPFKWPKGSRSKRPLWAVRFADCMRLRKISTGLGEIQWGEPFKVYDEKEIAAWMVKRGMMRSDWRTAYQAEMRATAAAEKKK